MSDWHEGDLAYLDGRPERRCEVRFVSERQLRTEGTVTVRKPPVIGLLQEVRAERLTHAG